MHKKFSFRRAIALISATATTIGGTLVAIDAPAFAANDLGYNSTVDSSLTFDGTSQYATTGTAVIPTAASFTAEAYFKENSGTTGQSMIIAQGTLNVATGRFALGIEGAANSRNLKLWVKDAAAYSATTAIVTQSAWHHVAVAFTSGTGYSVYLDGSLVATVANTGTSSLTGGFFVGRNYYAASEYFPGSIDEVKIWNTVRTATQVASDMHVYGSDNTTTFNAALVSYYDMNEGSGTTVYNRTATSGINLTTSGSPTFSDVKSSALSNGRTVVTFPRTYLTPGGGWTVPATASKLDALVIGGGGGGASRHAGGGGAGEVGSYSLKAATTNSVLRVKVGAGGLGMYPLTNNGSNSGGSGQSSILGTDEFLGGGGGQGGSGAINPGGSGGGTAGSGLNGGAAVNGTGSTSTPTLTRYANAGGSGNNNGGTAWFGGGGGGAGAAGTAATSSAAGAGGQGFSSSISGSAKCYAAGGGGGASNSSVGAAGTCANGATTGATAGTYNAAALPATANTGSGGGAGGLATNDQPGGHGGSGVIIISYASVDDNYLSLNGTSQYANAAGAQVIPATGAFTVEAWINPISAGAPSIETIASQGTGSNRFYVKRNAGKLVAYRDQATMSSEVICGALPDDKWAHIAISFDNTNAYCFINGSLVYTTAFVYGSRAVNTGFYIGQYSADPTNVNAYWKGGIDQVKIWNTAITDPAIIARSMYAHADTDATGQISGLTNFYDFNESLASATVEDRVGSTNLTIAGSASRSSIVETSVSGTKNIYMFPRTFLTGWGGWFAPSDSNYVSALIVGAGGGGGKPGNPQSLTGGTGGAGAVYPISSITLPTTSIPVSIGAGGVGGSTTTGTGANGGYSAIGTLKVAGGGGGNSYQFAGTTPAAPGGSNYVAGGNGGGGRQDTGASTQTYAYGGVAGSAQNQTYNGVTYTALSGVAGGREETTDSGTGGRGGQSTVRTSSISGTSVEYGKSPAWAPWGAGLKTPGSGGTTNYGYGTGTTADNGDIGANGVVYLAFASPATVTYNYNGATGGNSTTSVSVNPNASTVLPTPTKSGSKFVAWYSDAGLTTSAGNAGASYTPTDNITLYAKWSTSSPILYYNFSDRASTYDGTTAVTNLGSNSSYTGTKIGTLTHDYTTGKLSFPGGTNSAGPYIDVADINTTQFASNGMTIDIEVDFGTADNWERAIDLGASAPGTTNSNLILSRAGTTNDLWFELYDGSVTQGGCKVVNGLLNTGFARWTISVDGTNCRIYKDGVAQTTYISTSNSNTSLWAGLPKTGVNWTSNFIGRSNWTADAQFAGTIRSVRLFTGALTPDEAGAITYRTVNFDGNYTGSSAITSRYTSGQTSLQDAPVRSGYTFSGWYDNIVSASGTLIGASGAVYSPLTTPMNLYAAWVSSAPKVNVNFDELNFDFANAVAVVGTNGKTVGDKYLFRSVTTKGGIVVDALVTTEALSNATLTAYESGTGAGGANSYFQVDADIAAANGYAQFKFDFYQHGATAGAVGDPCKIATNPTCNGATKVVLQNVNVSAIDIDYYQWNDLTSIESYTVASNTKLTECNIPATGTCTARQTSWSYPSDIRAQGNPDTSRTNDPVDMLIVSYGEIETFRIKFGRSATGKPNYYGVAFKALPWGSTTPTTNGATNYTVAYNLNGGTGTTPTSVTGPTGTNFTAATTTGTKAGYTFSGWNTAADGSGTTYTSGTATQIPLNGMTLYAVWVAAQLTLTYDANGGSGAPAVESRNAGATANLSATVPTRAGYVFGGWNTLAGGTGTNYSSGASYTMGSANTTLYAKWTAATGSIAYNGNSSTGGAVPTTQSGSSGSSTTTSAVGTLVRQYYTFSGWNTAANGSGTDYSAGGAITFPANGVTTTLYAQWTAVLYTLTYNANGGTLSPAVASVTYAYNATVNITGATPTRTGYTFAGWTVDSAGTGTVYGTGTNTMSMPGANTVLYAKWTAITYTLTYDKNDAGAGNAPAASTGNTYGASVTVAAAPTAPTGMKFNGWNTAANGSGSTYSVGGTYQITANATLYAQWVVDSVNLFYSANGGTGAPTSTTATANSNTTLSNTAPTRTGYTFSGWTTNQNGSGTVYGAGSTFPVPGSDTTLYAKWTPISYNFIYDANGGSGAPATVAYYMGDFVTIAGSASRTGYTFDGWNTLAAGTGADYIAGQQYLMTNSNMTMYAKWIAIPYTLSYNANGGGNTSNGETAAPTNETRYVGATANLSSTTPTRTGYAFGSWNTAANGTGTSYNASAAFTMSASHVVLYAQWVANGNSVTYNVNGGSSTAPSGGTYSFNSSVPVSNSVPTWSGHRFLGWNTAQNGSGTTYASGDSFTMPNSAVTLYAQWALTTNVFSYDANGGSGAKPAATYSYGSTVTVTTDAVTRAGYTFIGWNSMADGTGTNFAAGGTFTMPANDVTAYAIWSANAYTLYYNMNGGAGSINAQPGSYQSVMTVSATVPTRAGYTFSGWSTVVTGSGGTDYTGGGTFNMPASNVTLFAKWTAIHYTLTYNANGGSGSPADVTGLSLGDSITLSATKPVRTGYVFAGWTTAANGTGAKYAESGGYIVPAANTTLYAQWIEERYEIIYNANGGSGAPAAEDVTPGSRNLSSTVPTRPGYTFGGWNTQVNGGGSTTQAGGSFTVPSGNTILYAIWVLADVTVHFDVNGSTDAAPSSITDKYQAIVTLAGSTGFARSGYTFTGWNTAANGSGQSYAAESDFVLPDADVTLYAQWSAVYYAVEYSANGGTGEPADQFANPGDTVNVATAEPTRAGYDFTNWTSANPGNTVAPGGSITMPSSNVLLVANWVVKAASLNGGGSSSGPVASPSPSPSVGPKKLTSTVYFKGDSAVLQPAAKKILKALALKAKAYGTAAKVQVIGRVKETNDKSYDMRLSRQRATNVANYLKKLGVRGGYVITAAGISPENRAISRRVDMYLYWIK